MVTIHMLIQIKPIALREDFLVFIVIKQSILGLTIDSLFNNLALFDLQDIFMPYSDHYNKGGHLNGYQQVPVTPEFYIFFYIRRQILTMTSIDRQINLLCTGDILSGKSSFLEGYTESHHQQLHYKVFPLVRGGKTKIFLHEIQERYGMDAYLSYPYDGVLYFLNINEFHNPQWAILDQLSQISKLNGTNIFKIPLKLIVLSSKQKPYLTITPHDKINFIKQLEGLIDKSMIIFVDDQTNFQKDLDQFYRSIVEDEAPGISEGVYVNWQLKGVVGMIPFQNLMLNMKKIMETLHRQWIKVNLKWKQKMH